MVYVLYCIVHMAHILDKYNLINQTLLFSRIMAETSNSKTDIKLYNKLINHKNVNITLWNE